MWYPEWIVEGKWNLVLKLVNLNKVWSLVKNKNEQCQFLTLEKCNKVCKILTFEETR